MHLVFVSYFVYLFIMFIFCDTVSMEQVEVGLQFCKLRVELVCYLFWRRLEVERFDTVLSVLLDNWDWCNFFLRSYFFCMQFGLYVNKIEFKIL